MCPGQSIWALRFSNALIVVESAPVLDGHVSPVHSYRKARLKHCISIKPADITQRTHCLAGTLSASCPSSMERPATVTDVRLLFICEGVRIIYAVGYNFISCRLTAVEQLVA